MSDYCISMPPRDEAIESLKTYAAVSEERATQLVDAATSAAADEVLDLITAGETLASSVSEARVIRLSGIAQHGTGLLSDREIEVLFRVPATTARAIQRSFEARFPALVEALIRKLVAEDGDAESIVGDKYRITFNDPAALRHARELLDREGLTRDVGTNRLKQTMTLPQRMRNKQGRDTNPLDVLGLTHP